MKNLLITIILICVFIICYSKSVMLNAVAISLVFFVCGLGLLFEAKKTLRAKEVNASVPLRFWRFYSQRLQSEGLIKFIIISCDRESLRFYFYVIIFGILGTFCFAVSAFYLFAMYTQYYALT